MIQPFACLSRKLRTQTSSIYVGFGTGLFLVFWNSLNNGVWALEPGWPGAFGSIGPQASDLRIKTPQGND